ncbi:hypothetical protein PUN28_002801 [Cardiocondyla obscurior]|uniref:Uncharacterized protein n=1 Tax=Cardiocondyla obscurior TaxID=286306 RepID=A0AAW2GW36_9HYME
MKDLYHLLRDKSFNAFTLRRPIIHVPTAPSKLAFHPRIFLRFDYRRRTVPHQPPRMKLSNHHQSVCASSNSLFLSFSLVSPPPSSASRPQNNARPRHVHLSGAGAQKNARSRCGFSGGHPNASRVRRLVTIANYLINLETSTSS